MEKYLHSFPMIFLVFFVVAVCFAAVAVSPNRIQHSKNSLESQMNLLNSTVLSTFSNNGYIEDYIKDDPASAFASPSQPPPNIKKEKLLYTKEISIKQGRLKGIVRNFHPQTGLKDVDQYLGIPYAEAPIGSRRFMPPGASEPWQGLKIARHLPPVCPQNLPDLIKAKQLLSQGRYDQLSRVLPYLKNENEDCLYLNVYVPSEGIFYHSAFHHLHQQQQKYRPFQQQSYNHHHPKQQQEQEENKQKFPVIVYIHGESFEWNSGNPYDGSVLASYGRVIVVTLNYRLGVLGFMKPGTSEHTVSNFGLLDQIAALHWIKENIEFFGGDRSSVTLMGHGTGAVCVNFLMVSPVAPGLFHRAILMSGSAMSDWATTNHSSQITMQIIEGVGCSFNDDFLSCIRNKSYKDLIKAATTYPQFSTPLGPIVDGHVIPNQPYKVMGKYTELFSRYDLLFGVTEMESYHLLSPFALDKGLPEDERDKLLELYMQNRFKIRPDLALAATLKKYQDVYSNPVKATNYEHRDALLEILSDARVVGPLVQTGLFHAEVNPRNYMYVFGHNSAGGPFASVPYSIPGEELAFIFGAPLAPAGPFHTRYTPQEKLLSEAVMLYWSNFAKTGNPKAPWRESFINMHAIEWKRYDIHWPEFNKKSQSYFNIGIPPAAELKYRNMYMNFWNKELPDELNEIGTIPPSLFRPYSPQDTEITSASDIVTGKMSFYPPKGNNRDIGPIWTQGHLNRNPVDRTTENSLRTLKLLTQNIKDDMYNAPPTYDGVLTEDSNPITENYAGTQDKIVRSEALVPLLIGLIITVLILNAAIYSAYLIQKKKKSSNGQKRKFGIISYDGTTDDELKISKNNDGDDSFILDICRKSSTIYDPIKPSNGFKVTNLSRQLSTSTVDAHTKVSDWITNDLSKTTDSKTSSSTFSSKCKGILKKPQKVSVAIDATPQNRSDSVLRQEPIEITKQKFLEGPRIICQEIDFGPDGDSDTSSYCPEIQTIRIDHKHSHSDPVEMYYTVHKNEEKTTSFINEDINVTSRDINSPFKHPLSPEEQLQNLKRRNFPKVLPNYPSDGGGIYESSSTFNKRNSLPPNQFNRGIPPLPPPRTVSTLGRKSSFRRSNTIICSPLQLATEVDECEEDEPKITQNTLIVGPIVPKNKQESVYSTVKRKPPPKTETPIFSSFQSQGNVDCVDDNNDNCVNVVRDDGDYEEYQMNAAKNVVMVPRSSSNTNSKMSRIPQLRGKHGGNSIYSSFRATSLSSSTASASSSGSTATVRTSELKQ